MSNIIIPKEIRSEFRVEPDGKAFVSIRGAARIADVDHSTLVKSFKSGGGLKPSELAQMLIDEGFEPGDFSKTGVLDLALRIVLKYYAHKAKETKEQAEKFYDAMSAVGIRTWIQQQLGWKPLEVKPEQPASTELKLILPTQEELDFINSRCWEKDEIERWVNGGDSKALAKPEDVMEKSGFARAKQAALQQLSQFEQQQRHEQQKEMREWAHDRRKGENTERAIASFASAISGLRDLSKLAG